MCRNDIVSTKQSFSKVRVCNHQDKCSMKKLRQHDKMAACCNFRVVEDDLKLFCDVYIILCHVSGPNLGGELIVFILNEQLSQVVRETSTVSRSDDVFVIVL